MKIIKKLKLLPYRAYRGVLKEYSVIFYFLPFLSNMYRRRVELCLAECTGGNKILEVGFGSGLTFLNLGEMYEEIHGIDLTCDVEQVKRVFAGYNLFPDIRDGDVLKMSYPDDHFDTVLLISILEHLKPYDLNQAFAEIKRVLKPGGQVVYGVPVERPLMVFVFSLLGYNIRNHHFSTERDVENTAAGYLKKITVQIMNAIPSFLGGVYEIGHFIKE